MKITVLVLMLLSSFAQADDGFGTDNLFNNLLSSPNLIARKACPDFKITADESLQISAQEDSFIIEADDGSLPVYILVPSQGHYIFQGQSPDRTADEIVSPALDLKVSMNPDTTDITLENLGSTEEPCVLTRCPAFGVCQ